MTSYPKSSVLPVLLCFVLIFAKFSESQEILRSKDSERSVPSCSFELLRASFSQLEGDVSLYTLNLSRSAEENLICEPKSSSENSNFSQYVKCDNTTISIRTGFANIPRKSYYDRVRFSCSDTRPIQYEQGQPSPFAGVIVAFPKRILPDESVLHTVSAIFPDTLGQGKEGLPAYSGLYNFSSESRQWNVQFSLEVDGGSPGGGSGVHVPCINVIDDRIDCKVPHSDTDLYLVNVGGRNPTETHLQRPCLDSSVKNTCGNKYPGTNCKQNRYCKKISPIHQHGLIRCSTENLITDVEYFRDIDTGIHTNMSGMWEEMFLIRIQSENFQNEMEISFEEGHYDSEENTSPSCQTQGGNAPAKRDKIPVLYHQQEREFECHFVEYFLVAPVIWFVEWGNGTKTKLFVDYGENFTKEKRYYHNEGGDNTEVMVKIKSSHLKLKALYGMQNLGCKMMYWNSNRTAKNVQVITVVESKAPEFSEEVEISEVPTGETLELKCKEKNYAPPPAYTWEFDGRPYDNNGHIFWVMENGQNVSVLKITNAGTTQSGEYKCKASNFRGKATKTFRVSIYDSTRTILLGLGITSMCIVILLVVTLVSLYKRFRKQRARLSKLEIKEFMNGNKSALSENIYAHEKAKHMAYNKDYELSWNDFELEQQELGKGVHGVVYRGRLGKMPIAVKTVREGVDKQVLKALLDELKIMIYLEKHDHIVELKGGCTQFLEEGRAYILIEFCPLGSLEGFLRKNKDKYRSEAKVGDYANVHSPKGETAVNVDFFTMNHLNQWSLQIAQGMKYLEEKKVIHGDLAVRNVLMTSMDNIKLTDFGLSRQLINTDTYVKTHQELLPWRHLALEAMKEFTFTSKTDVWSYGVTIWELFTLGSIPYPGMNWTTEFVNLLEENMRLYKPKYASEFIYKVMLDCWALEPEDRPSFEDLEMILLKNNE